VRGYFETNSCGAVGVRGDEEDAAWEGWGIHEREKKRVGRGRIWQWSRLGCGRVASGGACGGGGGE